MIRTAPASRRKPTKLSGRSTLRLLLEGLEDRTLLSVSNVLVNDPNTDTTHDTQSETSTVVFGNTIVTAYNDSGSFDQGNRFTSWSRSTNGGVTWTDMGILPGDNDAGDPVLARDNVTGRIYLAALGFTTTGMQLFRSDNNALSFQNPVTVLPQANGADKEWMAVDNVSGAGQGNLYVALRDFGTADAILFTRSTDHGSTFSNPISIASGAAGNVQGVNVVVGANHEVYVFWYDSTDSNSIKVRKSTDQGQTFGPEITVAPLRSAGINGDLGLEFRTNAFPQAAVNPVNGNIYVVFNDQAVSPLDRGDVYFVQSRDGGATWSSPLRVNNDNTANDQYMPTVSVSPNGQIVSVSFYDRRNDPGNFLIDYFAAFAGVDLATGNVTFQNNQIRVTNTSFAPAFGNDDVVNPTYMGDYDVNQTTNSAFYYVWGDDRLPSSGHAGNQQDVRFSRKDFSDFALVGVNDSYAGTENTTLVVPASQGVLTNDSGFINLHATLVAQPTKGTLTFNSDGSFQYIPNPYTYGIDTFTYRPVDNSGVGNITTVTLNIAHVNHAPVANPDGRPPQGSTLYLVHPGNSINIAQAQGVLANDSDPDSDPISAVLISNPQKASSFTFNANGSFSYTAAPGTTGDDQFFYEATDGQLFSPPVRVLIHINTPTLAQDDKYDTYVGNPNPIAGNVLTNDIDNDITNNMRDTLTAVLVSPPDPTKGSLTLNPNGTFTFTPSANFTSGTTTFTYQVNDGWENGNVATVTLYMDRLPVAVNDSYNVRFGNSLEIFSPGMLANDTDADLPQTPNPPFFQYLNVSAITQQPAHGTLTWNANGYFLYTPNANFNGGVDTFRYRVNDGLFDGSEGTVTINVQGIPVAQNDAYVTYNRSLNVAPGSGVLANDSPPPGNANLMTARLVSTTGNGQLTLNPDGSFQYNANVGFTGIDQFTYVASVPDPLNPGQTLDSAPATVSLTVYVNSSPPIARDDSYTTPANTALNVVAPGVILNDSDPNNDPLSAFLVSAPHNGTLVLNYDGSFTYTPQNNFQGIDSYSYQVSDGRNFSNVATVTITVGNPVPVANPNRRIIEAQDVGGSVKVFAGETGQSLFSIQPYGASFAGGIRVAVGDLNGDGVPDIITAPGPTTGTAQRVRVFNGVNGAPLNGTLGTGFFPFGSSYKGGIQVASGDVNGDGIPDIVVGADVATTSPQVHVINGATGLNFSNWLGGFSPYTGTTFGGVRVAVGDVNGDGKGDIISSPGAGTPTVKVYNAAASTLSTALIRSFAAYTTNVAGGVYVAAGDLDGDGRAEVITGAAANSNGQVRIFNGTTGGVLRSLTLTGSGLSGPARVALGDINGDGRLDLVVGQANSGGSKARVYDAITLSEMFVGQSLFTYGGGYNQGLFVASLPSVVGGGIGG